MQQTTVWTKGRNKLGRLDSIIAVSADDISPHVQDGCLILDDHGTKIGIPLDWVDHWQTFEVAQQKMSVI